ncbi:hypothetical protein [Sphaerotilus mobilis]|uniref:Uncharacterized protein n=1 Tax=Sphaerotilus mobilis TaxID=47994 RepID=A0A4Q7LLD5_9BURK|nr:hypothetical protein [Sphaerotilus mobilis]RZS54388.1 hypothetical protein EV685_1865 [Sphaerotilus mobilis]
MTLTLPSFAAPAALLTTLALVACGGGSEGGVSGTAGPNVPAMGARLSVGTGNYETVAVDAVYSAAQFASQASMTTLVGALSSGTVLCAGGGSVDVKLGAGSNGRLDQALENATLVFDGCVQSGYVFNGKLVLGLNAAPTGSVASGSYAVDATLLMTNFSADDGQIRLVANGLLGLTSTRTAAGTGRDQVDTSALALSVTPSGGSSASYVLHGYSAELVLSAGALSATYRGSLTSSRLGNRSVDFSTTTPFTTAAGATFPSAGVAIAIGSNNSKATLTVLDATRVRLDVDTTGDGSVESTVPCTWASIAVGDRCVVPAP